MAGVGAVGDGSLMWRGRGYGWSHPLLPLGELPQHFPICWLGHNQQQPCQKGQVEGSDP